MSLLCLKKLAWLILNPNKYPDGWRYQQERYVSEESRKIDELIKLNKGNYREIKTLLNFCNQTYLRYQQVRGSKTTLLKNN